MHGNHNRLSFVYPKAIIHVDGFKSNWSKERKEKNPPTNHVKPLL
jgi:hypothetical protein